ncbi:hypothetical protein PN823_004467 [Enterobacter hormaechei]|nr:hypothetical protein [Enterobacter hormaechei]
MKTKTVIVWSLSIAALMCSFGAAELIEVYAQAYGLPDLTQRLIGIPLSLSACFVMLYSERYPHRWRRYIGFWMLLAVIGLFAPHFNSLDAICYAVIGCAPLVLICAMWLVKRYWTIRVIK